MDTHTPRAELELGNIANRSEKGSAMSLIRAEAKATGDKTARLRALRMEREAIQAAEAAAAPKPVKAARKSRAKATA
ncbi:hypothetical protein [Aureimonas sp. AU4]|jgi:hypothetical protein|uniref:hypothetical protein n=1 Tax=Aureimonas sp. AU4 TaxID=1638163 RepID=UPI000781E46D|nr:hypothetical protein [Aureimonas sp. AU4]